MLLGRTLQPGQTLAKHELLLSLSTGSGVATTWLARPAGKPDGGLVIIKTVPANALDDPELEQLLLDELERAAQVHHPVIAETLAWGLEDGFLYVVAEWVEGIPIGMLMRAAVAEKGLPLSVAIHLVLKACEGLSAVHGLRDAQGLPVTFVHCAVSPQNVMVTFDGRVKIVDLGVGGVLGRTSGATTFRHMLGKFSYLSPEQLWSKPIDCRTDTFALGLLLYELTTCHHPFQGATERETTSRILSPEPAVLPSSVVPAYPPELEQVVMKALEKKLELRYPSAYDLRHDIAAVAPVGIEKITAESVAYHLHRLLPEAQSTQRAQQADAFPEGAGGAGEAPRPSRPAVAMPRATDWAASSPRRPLPWQSPGYWVLGILGMLLLVGGFWAALSR
jgi:serine/threonine-protein kinase